MFMHETKSCGWLHALTAALLMSVFAGIAIGPESGHAAAPAVKTQAPGFYRFTLGDFEITTILDGTIDLDTRQILTNVEPGRADALLARQFLTQSVETSVNTFLVNTGSRLVLVDTGTGSYFGPTLGKVVANLRAAGYAPEQIDDVLITHMHGDHIGGLVTNGKRTFPNAVLHADQREADYWLSKAELDRAPAEAKGGFENALASVRPYVDAKKFHAFNGDEQIVPGIRSIAAVGHTPGHTIYSIESKGEKLMLWGDLLHVAAVQFPQPSVTVRFDSDSKAAELAREKELREAANEGYWVGVAHVPFPGLGHVRMDGDSYVWVPANYSANHN